MSSELPQEIIAQEVVTVEESPRELDASIIAASDKDITEGLSKEDIKVIIIARYEVLRHLGYTPEAIEKLQNTTPSLIKGAKALGRANNLTALVPDIDLVKVVNLNPSILGHAPESVKEKVENLIALIPGIDLAKVVNAMPAALNFATESLREKIENLKTLISGIDLTKVVNAMPQVLTFAPESVREKVGNLTEILTIAGLPYTCADLLNTMPSILSVSQKKLGVLLRVGVSLRKGKETEVPLSYITASTIVPLEKILIALSRLDENDNVGFVQLIRKAQAIKLSATERKEKAASVEVQDNIPPSVARAYQTYLEKPVTDDEKALSEAKYQRSREVQTRFAKRVTAAKVHKSV